MDELFEFMFTVLIEASLVTTTLSHFTHLPAVTFFGSVRVRSKTVTFFVLVCHLVCLCVRSIKRRWKCCHTFKELPSHRSWCAENGGRKSERDWGHDFAARATDSSISLRGKSGWEDRVRSARSLSETLRTLRSLSENLAHFAFALKS
jgi:hypothetical protein